MEITQVFIGLITYISKPDASSTPPELLFGNHNTTIIPAFAKTTDFRPISMENFRQGYGKFMTFFTWYQKY